ncbi:hypothetical protein JTE90_023896 [Oedothorax gibbosus]|uniref:glutathione transferase n=1 Tax=Oedothorax gibbosus TaxID=931172 RepID=A0AAV6ULK6_9ARAC|nr:hypothetical protein JTE90_023896 [Oedothorax gibbosus]
MSSKPLLGYWELRGRAAPIRYLLHYKGIDFEEKNYAFDNFGSAWFKEDKFNVGLDFPNLPYYIDGPNVKLTQTLAILRYLGRRYGLQGTTEQSIQRVEVAEQQLYQLRDNLRTLCANVEEFDKLRPEYLSNLQGDLGRFEAFLGYRKFIAGDEITYVDFLAYEMLDVYGYFTKGMVFQDFKRLGDYRLRVRSLPSLKSYLESPEYNRWPIWAPFLAWGGRGPEPVWETARL